MRPPRLHPRHIRDPPPVRLGEALGGAGKKAAGVVITADPAHTAPAHLKRRGVGGVTMPSTITHIAYAGRESAKLKMLQV